jgi:hypothetical protein
LGRTGDYAGKRGVQFYYEIPYYILGGWSAEGDEKYSGKYHSRRLRKYNNVNPSRPTGRVGGYNWRNVNEPGLYGSLRIFSSMPSVHRLCREAAVIIKALILSKVSCVYFFPRRRRATCPERIIS